MSHRNEIVELSRTVIVGVDTHKHIHVAVVLATCPVHPHNKGFRLRAVSLC